MSHPGTANIIDELLPTNGSSKPQGVLRHIIFVRPYTAISGYIERGFNEEGNITGCRDSRSQSGMRVAQGQSGYAVNKIQC